MGIITPEGNVIVLDDDNGKLTLYINGDIGVTAKVIYLSKLKET